MSQLDSVAEISEAGPASCDVSTGDASCPASNRDDAGGRNQSSEDKDDGDELILGSQVDESGDIEEQFLNFSRSIQRHGLLSAVATDDTDQRRLSVSVSLRQTSHYGTTEAARLYRQLFFNSVDYVGLFRVNRPAQTEETSVGSVKEVRRMFEDLILDIEEAKDQLGAALEDDVHAVVTSLSEHMRVRLESLKRSHDMDVSRVRRAYRARLADCIAQITFDAEKNRQSQLKNLKQGHEDQIRNLEAEIYETKKQSRHCEDEIVKLRSSMMRLQTTMKRNGISDTEAGATIYQTIDDQRVKQSELLEHYQRALQLRDDKIRHLHEQLSKLEGLLRYKGDMRSIREARTQGEVSGVLARSITADEFASRRLSSSQRASRFSGRGKTMSSLAVGDGSHFFGESSHQLIGAFGRSVASSSALGIASASMAATGVLSGGSAATGSSGILGQPRSLNAGGERDQQGAQHRSLAASGTQTNVVDSVDIQVAQSKPEMLRAAYESRIAQIKAMHRTTANALIEETRGLDDQFKAQFAAICQEARDASVLKRIGQTKFVILETAKLLFPSKPLMGIPCETQCDLDKGKF